MTDPFAPLAEIEAGLRRFCAELDPDEWTAAEAAEGIERVARLDRLTAGARLRWAKRIDESVVGGDGNGSKARWLAKRTGQSPKDAEKDLKASDQLDKLPATDQALRNGELSPTQAHEVTSGAGADPSAELDLLDTAKNASVPELKRKAKKVRAAATNNEDKARQAEENRDLSSGVDDDEGEGWFHGKGPAHSVAEIMALLEPWGQAEFDKARRAGTKIRRGQALFDGLLIALRFAAACRNGKMTGAGPEGAASKPGPVGPPATILARVDVAALKRGHTLPGETCEIDGLGPVPVEALRAMLPDATIKLIVTNGVDAFNITTLSRRSNAHQQTVLDWIGGQCTSQGCGATRHLQVDHRIDWAMVKITELRNLDWLCVPCHRRKTHQGWALVPGRGRRRMVPPDDPDHPKNANAPPGRNAA